ncbi:MAG TPA: hypothetical protein VGK81_04095 [Anaerolineae bacterium]|jgi:uncharacterized membrane protein YccC
MSEQNTPRPEGTQSSTSEAWQEVGKQFQTLGESLATAFRTAWADEQNRKRMLDMRQGVEQMLHEVGKALDETAKSPNVQQAKVEAKRAAESMRVAGEQTYKEVRPQLESALRQLNDEVQKLIGRMDAAKPAENTPSTPAEPPAPAAPSAPADIATPPDSTPSI